MDLVYISQFTRRRDPKGGKEQGGTGCEEYTREPNEGKRKLGKPTKSREVGCRPVDNHSQEPTMEGEERRFEKTRDMCCPVRAGGEVCKEEPDARRGPATGKGTPRDVSCREGKNRPEHPRTGVVRTLTRRNEGRRRRETWKKGHWTTKVN